MRLVFRALLRLLPDDLAEEITSSIEEIGEEEIDYFLECLPILSYVVLRLFGKFRSIKKKSVK